MAVFLLIYIVIIFIWLAWALILTYHLLKYRFPNDRSKYYLLVFWGVSGFILLLSIWFISKANWVSVPSFLDKI